MYHFHQISAYYWHKYMKTAGSDERAESSDRYVFYATMSDEPYEDPGDGEPYGEEY